MFPESHSSPPVASTYSISKGVVPLSHDSSHAQSHNVRAKVPWHPYFCRWSWTWDQVELGPTAPWNKYSNPQNRWKGGTAGKGESILYITMEILVFLSFWATPVQNHPKRTSGDPEIRCHPRNVLRTWSRPGSMETSTGWTGWSWNRHIATLQEYALPLIRLINSPLDTLQRRQVFSGIWHSSSFLFACQSMNHQKWLTSASPNVYLLYPFIQIYTAAHAQGGKCRISSAQLLRQEWPSNSNRQTFPRFTLWFWHILATICSPIVNSPPQKRPDKSRSQDAPRQQKGLSLLVW